MEILKRLEAEDPETRRLAAAEMAEKISAEYVPALLKSVGDPDWRVRKTALDALVSYGGEQVFEGLYRALFSEDNAGARNSAAEGLIRLGSDAARALSLRLGEPDIDVRKFIVDIIGEIGDLSCVDALIKALDDSDMNVRSSAMEHLGKMKATSAIPALVGFLKAEEQWLAFNAAAALGELGDPAAAGPLMEASRDSFLREPALDALCRIGEPSAWPVFEEALKDEVPVIREIAVKGAARVMSSSPEPGALARKLKVELGPEDLELIKGFIGSYEPELSKSAARLMGWMRERSAVGAIAKLLYDDELKDDAFAALFEISKDGVEPLIFLLNDEDAAVRRACAELLGMAGDARAVKFLLPLLEDEDGHTRSAAVFALGKLRAEKSASRMLELLRDEYQDVQETAIKAVASIPQVQDELDLKALSQDPDPSFRRNIAFLCGLLGKGNASVLEGLLKDEDAEVRTAAVDSISTAGEDASLGAVLKCVVDEDARVRLSAVNALMGKNVPGAAEPMFLLLKDSDPWVRAQAARALSYESDPRVFGALLSLLSDNYGPVKMEAVEGLGRTGMPDAGKHILNAMSDSDPEVRKAGISAALSLREPEALSGLKTLAKDPDWSVRKAALEALAFAGIEGSAELLASAAQSDPERIVRDAAARLIGEGV
ncbi:MAG: HEAT repeat domain-containing protein [Nitrospirota bacterium]